MKLKCSDVIEIIRSDFGQLWSCERMGESLGVSSPYLLPNHSHFTMWVTIRDGDRIIVSDAGRAMDLIAQFNPNGGESVIACRDYFMGEHDVDLHIAADGRQLFFKETRDIKLVPSLMFDLGNFAVNFCTSAIPYSVAEAVIENTRFSQKADGYIRGVVDRMPDRGMQKVLEDIPAASFGAVVYSPDFAHLWLVSYVTGSSRYQFTRNLSSAIVNFMFVRESLRLVKRSSLITLVNDETPAYQPDLQKPYFEKLREITHQDPIVWQAKEEIVPRLKEDGPPLEHWRRQ